MRDEDYGAALTLAEGDDGIWSPPMAASACEQPDWRSLNEQAHTRAGEGAGAGGRGASARRRAAPGGGGFPGGFAEVAARHLPEQAEGGLRGDEGGPARGEGRAFLPGGSGAAGNTPFASRRRVEQAQHDHVAAHGGRRLRKAVKASQARTESLEGQLAKLRATGTVLSKALYGAQERAAGEGALRAQARSAARRRRPWPHAAARARGTNRRAQSAEGCAGVFLLREALRGERRAFLDRHRDRSQGPHTRRIVRPRWRRNCDCASSPLEVSAPPVPRLFPRTPYGIQLLGTLPVRALCLLPAPAPRCRVAVRPGAGGFARDAGQHSEALRGAVRAGGRGDPRAPERGGAAPCRRDHLARPGAPRGGPVESGLAVDLGQQRRGLLPHRSEPAVPRRRTSCSPRLCSIRSSSATATAPTRGWRAFSGDG